MKEQEEEGSRLHQCLVFMSPLEPTLLHRWTSLKVKTVPHQGFVKENGCIFLEAIIFILLSVLKSNPYKPSFCFWTDSSIGLLLQSQDEAGDRCWELTPWLLFSPPFMEGCRKHPDHQRSKSRMNARAGSMPGQGGYLGHSRDFEGGTVAYSYPAHSAQTRLLVLL